VSEWINSENRNFYLLHHHHHHHHHRIHEGIEFPCKKASTQIPQPEIEKAERRKQANALESMKFRVGCCCCCYLIRVCTKKVKAERTIAALPSKKTYA